MAGECGSSGVQIASTYRRLQRFFQHVRLAPDWAAPLIAGLAGGAEKRVLILERTNWKFGAKHVNLLVPGVATRHSRFALMWIVLDRAGNSGAAERTLLLERYIAMFGKESIDVLLADREFIGADWINYLIQNDITFVTCFRGTMLARRADGIRAKLALLPTSPRKGRHATASLTGIDAAPHFAAKVGKGREPVIVGTNRPGIDALNLYRKRWAIACFLGNAKTRGLNLEDTHLPKPEKLAPLMAIIALVTAWAARAARYVMLVRLAGRDSASVTDALIDRVTTLPANLMQTLTWDQGKEMASHRRFTLATDVKVFFCDPASPWQRGRNENTNGLLRQYFPKGTSLASVTQEDLDAVALSLNTRPRKTLEFQTPADRLQALMQ